MTTKKLNPHTYIANAFYSHPIEQRDANVLSVFNEFKSSFKLNEAFKIKGKLYEFYQSYAGTYTYYLILKDGAVLWHTGSNIYAPAIDKWREVTGTESVEYINGSLYYQFKNGAKDVEPVKMADKYLEFCKIQSNRMPGNKLPKICTQIKDTPYYITRSIMYTQVDGKIEFFYEKYYSIYRYDVEYNLSIEKRFNTRWYYSQLCANNEKETVQNLLKHLTNEHKKAANGYWGDHYTNKPNSPWVEPNPIEAAKLAKQVESVKQFLEGL